jgi:hypothetical protein
MAYQLTQVRSASGFVWPAVFVNDVYLANPTLNPSSLEDKYEKAVLAALKTKEGHENVKRAVNSGRQLFLKIGETWFAPVTVRRNRQGLIVALLHYGPA